MMGISRGPTVVLPALLAEISPSVVAEYVFFDDLATFELPFVAVL